VVILVGMQGAGKTCYCRTELPQHARLSQDDGPRRVETLVNLLGTLLASGVGRIVIDRTNPRREQRERLSELAHASGYRVRMIYFNVPRCVCEQRIAGRDAHPTLDPSRMAEAISRYQRDLDIPTADDCDELMVVQEN
jgi:predicted kinase